MGYQLVPHPSQMLLAHSTSLHARRSEFAQHALWVTKYADDELYAAGKYTLQPVPGGGIKSWIEKRAEKLSVRNEDVVLWHTFGTTHNPRVED
jgi:primary-amine oxidase